MSNIANYISCFRIILSLSLLFLTPFGYAFISVYLICGLSDVLDGFIARTTNTVTKLGSQLDSIADLVMVTVVGIVMYQRLSLDPIITGFILLIVVIRLLSLAVSYCKYKKLTFIHTYSNKITGLALFLFPLLYFLNYETNTILLVLCIIALLSATEELLIYLTSSYLDRDRKSIFSRSNQ